MCQRIICYVCAFLALLLGIGSAKFSAVAGQGLGANLREAEYAKLQQTVDSKTTMLPFVRFLPTVRLAPSTGVRSGEWSAFTGVGTATM